MVPSEAQRERALARFGLALSLLLGVAWMAPAPFAMLWPDTVRDLGASWGLVHDGRWPLAGPPINFGPHLGPAWPWLQAIPLAVSPSLAAVATVVAAVAGLRFWLLFALGRALGGARLGLCVLAAAAFPSIAVYQWEVFFHPDWVATAVVLSLLLLTMAVSRRSTGWHIASALALGLAVQMHPTAIFYAPLHAWAITRVAERRALRVALAVALVVAVAAWFVPLVFADLPHGAQLATGGTRVAGGLRAFDPGAVANTLATVGWRVPHAAFTTYGGALGLPGIVFFMLYGLVALGAGAGTLLSLVRGGAGRRAVALVLAALVAAVACAVAVREYTSFYLAYFAIPLLAMALGLGFHGCVVSRVAALRGVGIVAATASVVLGLVCVAGAVVVGGTGELRSSLPFLSNLRDPAPGRVHARTLGALARDRFADFACASGEPLTVHGDLAYAWAASTGIDFAVRCPGRPAPLLLGTAARDVTVLTRGEARALGRSGGLLEASGLQLHAVRRVVHPRESRAIEPDWYHFEQLRDRQPVRTLAFDITPVAGEVLMVHRLKPFDSRAEPGLTDATGAVVTPCMATFTSEGYCARGDGVAWRLEITTDAPQWIDIYLL